MKKKYTSTEKFHTLTYGNSRVAIKRTGKAKITQTDKEMLDKHMDNLLELRNSEPLHRVHKK